MAVCIKERGALLEQSVFKLPYCFLLSSTSLTIQPGHGQIKRTVEMASSSAEAARIEVPRREV